MKFELIFLLSFFTFNVSSEDILNEFTISILQILLCSLRALLGYLDITAKDNDLDDVEYDYIVVGSGAAGSSLASVLVKHGKSVLLLEAGETPWFTAEVPFLLFAQLLLSQNWGYLMEKQENTCLGLEDQLMAWPSGKVLGGSSQLNMMIYSRGNKLDYDRWAAAGNPGWSYKDLFPIFIEMENAHFEISDPNYHGYNGSLDTSDIPYRTASGRAFVESAQQSGHAYVDYNGANQMGVSYVQCTLRNGKRCGAEKAYIQQILFKPNLKLSLNSHVTKVLIHENNKTADGVEYVKFGLIRRRARARKEVILSAGTFHSPQILMLSGIGPQDHLTELGIPVIQNLPVGMKLYDHICFLGLIWTINSDIVISLLEVIGSIGVWLFFGMGPLTSPAGVESLLFFKTSIASYSEMYPDIELMYFSSHLHTDYGMVFRKVFRIKPEVYDELWKPLEGKWAVRIMPVLLHPKSVGKMKLRSKNPFDSPKLYGNYFTDSEKQDLRTFLAAIEESKRIMEFPAFQKYNATLRNVPVPGCEQHVFDTPPYWECALRSISVTIYHQTSTCKMGPETDPEAVVNHKLQVYGINNLRVADTSIIPHPLSGHTNIPAYVIGTKAGYELLRGDL